MVLIGLPLVKKNLQNSNTGLHVRTLGETLKQNGLKAAVLGNADTEDAYRRHVACIAMDSSGVVPAGDVSSRVLRPSQGLLSYRTDYDYLFQKVKELRKSTDLIVIELGDTSRLDEARKNALPGVYETEKKEIFEEIDTFLGKLVPLARANNSLLILATPTPSREGLRNKNLFTPLIAAGNKFGAGFLYTPTTRREGIVALTDIAPSILDYLDVDYGGMVGRPFTSVYDTRALEKVQELNDRAIFIYRMRPSLIKGYIFTIIAVLIVVTATFFIRRRVFPYLGPALMGITSVPLALLLVAGFQGLSKPGFLTLFCITVVLLTIAAFKFTKKCLSPCIVLSLFTALALIIDLSMGAPLMSHSILGYDAMSGARYYGIGNEYMGVLLGATIIGTAALFETVGTDRRLLIYIIAFIYIVVLFFIASPSFGANAGGMLSGTVAFGIAYLLLSRQKISWKKTFIILAWAAAIFTVMGLWDAYYGKSASTHLGRFFQHVLGGDWDTPWLVITRKVQMNIKLIKYTYWSRVFMTVLIVLAILMRFPLGVMGKVKQDFPFLSLGFLGVLLGSFAALAFNDSGIVAAATMMIFGGIPMIYLAIYENEFG